MTRYLMLLLFVTPMLLGSSGEKTAIQDAMTSATLLATLFDMGRVVVGEYQPVINDENKGDKGLTAKQFTRDVLKKFEAATHVSWEKLEQAAIPSQAKRLLPQLLEVQQTVFAEKLPLINLRGVGFKRVIPATFGTLVSVRLRRTHDVYVKQTAAVVRNTRNAPDDYETSVLATFASPSYPRGQTLSETAGHGEQVRVMIPLYYQRHCLACHGSPKGEVDMTGHPKEGGRLGELGGAISVNLPVNQNLRF